MARRGLDSAQVAAAAVRVADAEGLEAVTVARIAADLGIRGPSLYNHVSGRDGLLRAVALQGVTGLVDALVMATAGRSGPDALRAGAVAYREFAHAHPGQYAAGLRAPEPGDEEIAVQAARAIEVIAAGLRGFDLADPQVVHAVRVIRAGLHGFVALEAAGAFALKVDLERSFEILVDLLVAGVDGGVLTA
jgi:AcrR family transcriptional regulator